MTDLLFKVCLFGDGGVGKTTLVNRYLHDVFNEDTKMTIGVNFFIKELKIDGTLIKLQIWDFAGEAQFRKLLPTYVEGAMGGIFMYDITSWASLKNIDEWLQFFEEGTRKSDIPLFLLGGKMDLEEHRSIERKKGIELAEDLNFKGFSECSSKTGFNVEKAFEVLTELMMETYLKQDL